MLSKKQFYSLRSQIVLNSLFVNDYKNNLYIKPQTVLNFFDSAIEYIDEDFKENNGHEIDIHDIKISMLYDYYKYLDFDALPYDDYTAYLNFTALDGLLFYDVYDGVDVEVLIAYYYNDNYGRLCIQKPRWHKCVSDRRGNLFIKFRGVKYCLNDFIKIR